MTKIILSGVSKQYKIKNKLILALNNVSFTVDEAAFLAISGPSGSGKSTVLQLIGGIEPPTFGSIIVGEQNIAKMSSRELTTFRHRNIGIIFQQFYLDPTLTLRQNIELPAMFYNPSKEYRKQRTAELARQMGLENHLDHHPSELSGGQIQRAAIARAVYNRPSIIIADEPTSNLDQDNIDVVIRLFKQIQQAYSTTVIVATHDMDVVRYASQIIKLNNGSLVS